MIVKVWQFEIEYYKGDAVAAKAIAFCSEDEAKRIAFDEVIKHDFDGVCAQKSDGGKMKLAFRATGAKIKAARMAASIKPCDHFDPGCVCSECGKPAVFVHLEWFENPPTYLCMQCALKESGIVTQSKCEYCGKEIETTIMTGDGGAHIFCSKECAAAFDGYYTPDRIPNEPFDEVFAAFAYTSWW